MTSLNFSAVSFHLTNIVLEFRFLLGGCNQTPPSPEVGSLLLFAFNDFDGEKKERVQ